MRQFLLRTSAIALVGGVVSTAQAAEWEIRVGGYMEQFIAFAASDFDDGRGGDFDGIDSKQDAEIHFLPSITLDNGITIGADVQLEAFTHGDQIDEASLTIDGSFGTIVLGSEASAGYQMSYAAPDVTFLNVNSGSTTSFIPFSGGGAGEDIFLGTLGSTFIENGLTDNAQRFTYYTPRFYGVQLGVSYARDGLQDTNAQVDADATLANIFDIGANYVQTYGDLEVAVSGRWGIADAPGAGSPKIWAAGANLGYAGFTVGGSFAEQSDAGSLDGQSWDAGISYSTGPWGFSFTYFHGRNVGNGDTVTVTTTTTSAGVAFTLTATGVAPETGSERVDQFLLGANYALAKGVSLGAFAAYIDFEDAAGTTELNTDGSIDGFIIGTGIKISF